MMYSSTTDGMSRGAKAWRSRKRFDWNAKRVLILHYVRLCRLFVPDSDLGLDAAANRKIADDRHATRLAGGDEIVEDLIRDIFVENALIAELDQIVLERLQFDTELVGHVADANLAESPEVRFSDKPM